MESMTLKKELEQLFCEILKKEDIILTDETTAQDVDGWNSLTNMVIVRAIEKKYNIHFSFREIVKMKCVGDLCNVIQSKIM